MYSFIDLLYNIKYSKNIFSVWLYRVALNLYFNKINILKNIVKLNKQIHISLISIYNHGQISFSAYFVRMVWLFKLKIIEFL